MADYTYNSDKRGCVNDNGLYNSVLYVEPFPLGETEPVALQQAKDWGKIEQDTDDALITRLITAARRVCEKYVCIGYINREVTATITNSNGGFFLPYGPVTGTPTATDDYGNDLDIDYRMNQVHTLGQMTVTYMAGYSELPEDLMSALEQQFLYMYENRGEGPKGIGPIAQMILEPLRTVV